MSSLKTVTLQNPEYSGVEKIISGGQCGADFGGLLAAEDCGVTTGGFIPKGYRTHHGPRPDLGERFHLVETADFSYRTRTIKNVREADGTVIIAINLHSPGCTLTANTARALKKPLLQLQLKLEDNDFPALEEALAKWLTDNHILTLNVAGNRDKTGFIHEDFTRGIVGSALRQVNVNR